MELLFLCVAPVSLFAVVFGLMHSLSLYYIQCNAGPAMVTNKGKVPVDYECKQKVGKVRFSLSLSFSFSLGPSLSFNSP